ncbi:MAG TPA: glutamate--tRNA ligase, partial [Bacteroidetes bacterium]|nr:glutamate--tRNA ligase [Bacteroidota bacterium]
GKFLLRIEDTDRKRSTPEAINVILDGLAWLDLLPDEEPVYQSKRIERHIAAAQKMLEDGYAYRCFCTPDELEERRRASGDYMYDRHCLNLTEAEIQQKLADGEKFALRIRVPEGRVSFDDGVHGGMQVACTEIDDFILLRRNGAPTYMLAVVVDDADMGITHVIRGDDHLSNTPKQILIYRALGKRIPEFAHVPLILGKDRKRLSKRHGATSITEYRDAGYLPETMINFLGLLGWSPGDDRDIISRRELIELFDISGIQSKAAVFDDARVRWLNGQYLGMTDYGKVEGKLERLAEDAASAGELTEVPDSKEIKTAWDLLKTRIHFLNDLFTDCRYMFRDPDVYDGKGVRKHFLQNGVVDHLQVLADDFSSLGDFRAASVEAAIRKRAEEWEVSTGKLIHPLRLACSGVTGGPGLFEMLEALGRDTVVRRINNALNWIKSLNNK